MGSGWLEADLLLLPGKLVAFDIPGKVLEGLGVRPTEFSLRFTDKAQQFLLRDPFSEDDGGALTEPPAASKLFSPLRRRPLLPAEMTDVLLDKVKLTGTALDRRAQQRNYNDYRRLKSILFTDLGQGITPESMLMVLHTLYAKAKKPTDRIAPQEIYRQYSPKEQAPLMGVLATLVGYGLVDTDYLVPPGKTIEVMPNLGLNIRVSPETPTLMLTPKAIPLIQQFLLPAYAKRL
jgi:hypothetical protein